MIVSDEFIDDLFKRFNFGDNINHSTKDKRNLLVKTLRNQQNSYWSGSTIYGIVTEGGFLIDGESETPKKLTAFGQSFMDEYGAILSMEDI